MRRSATREVQLRELDLPNAPDLEANLLPPEKKTRYERLKSAILAWWSGMKPKEVERLYGVKRQLLDYFGHRFFQLHEDGRIQGFRMLAAGTRIDSYVRTKDAQKDTINDGYGTAGCFQQCLKQYPQVKDALEKALRVHLGADPLSVAINFKDLLQNVFLPALRKAGVPVTAYPFCTQTKAYQSLRKYATDFVRSTGRSDARIALFGHGALDAWDTGTRKSSWLQSVLPCDLCCYDEYQLPALGTVIFVVDGTRHVVPMERMSLCLLVSYKPRCILAYHVSMRPRVAAADFMETFANLLKPWQPKVFTAVPELTYKPGAGFPNGVVPHFLECLRIGLLRVDNDLVHYANAVLVYLRARFGLNIEYGMVRRWLTRYAVEQIFAQLQVAIAKLSSTTGSGPADRRVHDPVGNAVKFEITIDELRELFEVLLANLNGLPRSELYGATSLEAMTLAYASAAEHGPALPGYAPEATSQPIPMDIKKVVVRGNEKKGRHPYVEMDDQHYENDTLYDAWGLIGTPMIALLQRDHRQMILHYPDMREFGPVSVHGQWARSAHDRATRQEILRLRAEGFIEYGAYDDPVQVFGRQKRAQMVEHAKTRPGKVMRGSNKYLPTVTAIDDSQGSKPINRKMPKTVSSWTDARLNAQKGNLT